MKTVTGDSLWLFRLTNKAGYYVELSNWGARWITAVVPDSKGILANVLAKYNNMNELLNDDYYMGATIGPFANRISKACFTINNTTYNLDTNDGNNTNHGGYSGFNRKAWQWEKLQDGIRFTHMAIDGEGGYPGNLEVQVEYHWSDDNVLSIEYTGKTDRDTYLNMTNHAYFNLSGKIQTIGEHVLMIAANKILETNSEFIPTGQFISVADTPFDFTLEKKIGKDWNEDNKQLRWNRGYNHCYVLKEKNDYELKLAARLIEPLSGRSLEIHTDLPSILFYSAGYYVYPSTALCLEAQYFPDTPSHKNFPSCLLKPNETYRQRIIFSFSTKRI